MSSDFQFKMHKIRFPLGLRHRPRWGSSQRSPRLSSCKEERVRMREREGEGKMRGKVRGGEEREGKVPAPPKCFGLELPLGINDGATMMTPDCWIYDSEVLFQAHSAAPRILLVVVQSIIQAGLHACMAATRRYLYLPYTDSRGCQRGR